MHVSASAYLPMKYRFRCIACLQVSQPELIGDLFPKTSSFMDCGREYSGEYVSTNTSKYVCNQRTAVFWRASPCNVLRDACSGLCSLSFSTYD